MEKLRINIPIGLLLIAYGLFSISRWVYLLTILSLGYFGSVSALLLRKHGSLKQYCVSLAMG